MIQVLSLAAALIFNVNLPSESFASQANTSGTVAELTQIEHGLVKAWLNGDRKMVDDTLAAEWSVIDFAGNVLTKAQVMKEFGGDRKIESGSVDDLSVRVYGDTAVVTGRSVFNGSYQGKSASVTQRFTDVFIKRDGRWQVVASQATLIKQSTQ
jgi:ketosteroid isomerase-like protein